MFISGRSFLRWQREIFLGHKFLHLLNFYNVFGEFFMHDAKKDHLKVVMVGERESRRRSLRNGVMPLRMRHRRILAYGPRRILIGFHLRSRSGYCQKHGFWRGTVPLKMRHRRIFPNRVGAICDANPLGLHSLPNPFSSPPLIKK